MSEWGKVAFALASVAGLGWLGVLSFWLELRQTRAQRDRLMRLCEKADESSRNGHHAAGVLRSRLAEIEAICKESE